MGAVGSTAVEKAFAYASEGSGPLLERDYSAVIEKSRFTPEQVGALLREKFEAFAPPETASFQKAGGQRAPLAVGDALEIRIALMGKCEVRVVHTDDRSLTLRTVKGHPEAGRITFGADSDDGGRLLFHILSRTRASGLVNYLGFLVVGKQMQSRCWIRFIDRLAGECGGRIAGRIRVRTLKVDEGLEDRPGHDGPTFSCAKGK